MTGKATVADFLEHHGVLGMKWGVHRNKPSGPVQVSVVAPTGKRVKTSGGQNHPASADALKVAALKQRGKASSVSSLSNAELQQAVARMNLEQQYSRLAAPKQNAGKKFIAALLGNTAKQQAQRVVNDAATQRVNDALKKNSK